MPGLFGLWWPDATQAPDELEQMLCGQAVVMGRGPRDVVESQTLGEGFGMGRLHLGILDTEQQPVVSSDHRYALCLDGEFYDRSRLYGLLGAPASEHVSDAELALRLYLSVGWAWLRETNGQFAIVLYDAHTRKLQLVTDRFGLRPLYCHHDDRVTVFASEVKAILAVPLVKRRIDPEAAKEFFGFGYLLEDRTWMQGVRLLPAASVTSIDEAGYSVASYWSWDQIQPVADRVSIDEAAEELGRLWIQSIRRRMDDKRIGLTLSGGLDSRAVLAAIPEDYHPLHAVTFGIPGCDDHHLAARAAKVRGAIHSFVPISAHDWLASRLEAVWWTDGHFNLMHAHGIAITGPVRDLFDVNMHPLAGDLILGGSYLLPAFLNVAPSSAALGLFRKMRSRNLLFDDGALLDHLGNILAKYQIVDVFFLQNRVRRFTLNGPVILEASLFDRKPTYDNDLIDFCYSLPDQYRYRASVYKKMLLTYFPQFYRQIPWQKTGLPISASEARHRIVGFTRQVNAKVRYEAAKAGVHISDRRNYADYDLWTRAKPGRDFILRTLLSPNARWQNYLPAERGKQLVQEHLECRRLDAEGVLLLLTFEAWLQRLEV